MDVITPNPLQGNDKRSDTDKGTNTTKNKAMKKAILFTLIVVGLATIMYQQNEVNKLKKQLNATEQVFNQVYADNEDYFIDVLSETDAYQSYLETL